MFKKFLTITLTSLMIMSTLSGCAKTVPKVEEVKKEEVVTIEYWEYFYESKIKLIDKLIVDFQAETLILK